MRKKRCKLPGNPRLVSPPWSKEDRMGGVRRGKTPNVLLGLAAARASRPRRGRARRRCRSCPRSRVSSGSTAHDRRRVTCGSFMPMSSCSRQRGESRSRGATRSAPEQLLNRGVDVLAPGLARFCALCYNLFGSAKASCRNGPSSRLFSTGHLIRSAADRSRSLIYTVPHTLKARRLPAHTGRQSLPDRRPTQRRPASS